jgi:apolipoprotein N-acyltransferase
MPRFATSPARTHSAILHLNAGTCLLAGVAGGVITSLAVAPNTLWFAAIPGTGALTALALGAPSRRWAALGGLAFGAGFYLPTLGWLYTGIEAGDAPVLAYGAPTLLIFTFAAAPVFTASLGYTLRARPTLLALFGAPAIWTLLEWSRQFGAFRFPWGQLGYSQIDAPWSGLFPLLGVLGLSYLVLMLGGVFALILITRRRRLILLAAAALSLPNLISAAMQHTNWTRPVGSPLSVAVMQGNHAMEHKFEPERVIAALNSYRQFLSDSDAQLSIVPETALPLLEEVLPPGYLDQLDALSQDQGRDLLVSFFRRAAFAPAESRQHAPHYVSARLLGASGQARYDKRILLPFGEYVPAARWLRPVYERIARVPLLDTAAGHHDQGRLISNGHPLALRMCFEDVFGDFARHELAAAHFIIVLANDSWTGSDTPMHQHLSISRARALESSKPLVRVANTGWSGLIAADGKPVDLLPTNQVAHHTFSLQARSGVTPYLLLGDAPVIGFSVLVLLLSALRGLHAGAATPAHTQRHHPPSDHAASVMAEGNTHA